MYGIVEISGHQYQVSPGTVLDVEKLEQAEGSTINLEDILFIGGAVPVVGMPKVKGAKVVAKVIKHDRSRKLLVLKRKAGKWMKKKGHRQEYTSLFVTEIHDGQGKSLKVEAESKEAKKYL